MQQGRCILYHEGRFYPALQIPAAWVKESRVWELGREALGKENLWDGVSSAVCKSVLQEQEVTFQ